MPSKEDEARKLAEAASAASKHVFEGGPPVRGAAQPQGGSGGRPDWNCPKCGDLQFARNATCRRCGTPNPSGPPGGKGNRVGDWICPTCNDVQFARNALCRRCGTPNPGGVEKVMRPGDWQCPTCRDVVFARNPVCRRCQTPNPNPPAPNAPGQCRYWAQGHCKQGANCAFLHGDGSQGGGVLANRRQCKFWSEGLCRQGDNCPYLHGDSVPSANGSQNKGDVAEEPWKCPSCSQFVFPHFSNCLNCKHPKPVNAERMAPAPHAISAMVVSSMTGSMAMGGGDGGDAMKAAAAMAEQQLFSRGRDRSRSPVDFGPTCGN